MQFLKNKISTFIIVLSAWYLTEIHSSKSKQNRKSPFGQSEFLNNGILDETLADFLNELEDLGLYNEIKHIIDKDQNFINESVKGDSRHETNIFQDKHKNGLSGNKLHTDDGEEVNMYSGWQTQDEGNGELNGAWTDDFAVEINGDEDVAFQVAADHGFTLVKHIKVLGSVFIFKREKTSSNDDDDNGRQKHQIYRRDTRQSLFSNPKVVRVDRQMRLLRMKRSSLHLIRDGVYRGGGFRGENRKDGDDRESIDDDDNDDDDDDDRGGIKKKRVSDEGIETDMSAGSVNEGGSDSSMGGVGFQDPLFKKQWYLWNGGQTGGTVAYDLNVVPAWRMGYTGKGVVVSILDDGLDHTHPDLILNYDAFASADLNDPSDPDNDPMPNFNKTQSNHGTMCAGEVAAQANNSYCGVGIAFNARIGGIRILDGVVTDLLEAQALLHNNQYVHVYSASWGPPDNGKTMDGPRRYGKRALKDGVIKGRGGKGSIFVWATGNGGAFADDCNCDGYVASPYTLAIGSISDHGLSTYFSEVCASTMAVVFTGGPHVRPDSPAASHSSAHVYVVSTNVQDTCTTSFMGTSSAAPLAAGCVALALEANPSLTWRDVQHIVAETSIIPSEEEDGWAMNGGGYHVNERLGFGVLDCAGMVKAALNWSSVQPRHVCVVKYDGAPKIMKAGRTIEVFFNVSDTCNSASASFTHRIDSIEHLQVSVLMEHRRRGDVSIVVFGADGTVSNVLKKRPLDTSDQGIRFKFMSVRHWGEAARGVWKVVLKDHTADGAGVLTKAQRSRNEDNLVVGKLLKLSLIFHGVVGSLENHVRWAGLDGRITKEGKGGKTKMEKRKRNLIEGTEGDDGWSNDDQKLLKLLRGIRRRKARRS